MGVGHLGQILAVVVVVVVCLFFFGGGVTPFLEFVAVVVVFL